MRRRRGPRRSATFALSGVVLVVVATVMPEAGAIPTDTKPTSSPQTPSLRQSAHSPRWNSGVYPGNGTDLAAARAFARYVGRPLDNVHVFVEPSTWHTIGYESWEVRQYKGFPGQLVIDLPLLPSQQKASLGSVAAGRDDRYFAAMARKLVSMGRGDSVLVLGSEFNGNWQTYSAFRPRVYKRAFRHVARLLKKISRQFVIDWAGNAIDNQSGHNPFRQEYPGDRFVDVVGVDAYAYAESHIVDARSFDRWASLPFGIKAWSRFARRHHKKFSIPEWGLTASSSRWGSPTALGSGDVPAYITGMHRFMKRLKHHLAFEDYFNQPTGRNRNSLHAPNQMPKSSRRYRALWSTVSAPAARITPHHR